MKKTIHKVHSLIVPRWWQFRRRYRWWRMKRKGKKALDAVLTPEAQRRIDEEESRQILG